MPSDRIGDHNSGMFTLLLFTAAILATVRAAMLFASLIAHLLGLGWRLARRIGALGWKGCMDLAGRIRDTRTRTNVHLAEAGLYLDGDDPGLWGNPSAWRLGHSQVS